MGGELYLEDELQSSGAYDLGADSAAGIEELAGQFSERLAEMNARLDALQARVSELEQELARLHEEQTAAALQAAVAAAATPRREQASNETAAAAATIQDVLRKVYGGDAEGAQKLLLSLSKEEMQRNTSVVALVAATLCIQRGDMNGGLTALQRARQFTDDPRLLRVIDLVETQLGQQSA